MAQPIPDPDRPCPWEHEDDLERPGVSIRPLSHADLAALLARPDRDQHQPTPPTESGRRWAAGTEPVVAVRVRATVGRPGASAEATYQRRRAAERTGWARTLPLRLAGLLAAGAAAALLAGQLGRLAVAAGALAAAGVGWALRFRPSAETRAWRRGAAGERRTARALRPLLRAGWAVLHDVAIPGSRANGDHLLIGPPGVFLVDSKAWHGHITMAPDGSAWHDGHPMHGALQTVRWEADQLTTALGAPVLPVLCVHDTHLPWGELYPEGIPVLTPGRLVAALRALPAHMDQVGVMLLAEHVRHQLHPAT
jgi:Nuclease-related domain